MLYAKMIKTATVQAKSTEIFNKKRNFNYLIYTEYSQFLLFLLFLNWTNESLLRFIEIFALNELPAILAVYSMEFNKFYFSLSINKCSFIILVFSFLYKGKFGQSALCKQITIFIYDLVKESALFHMVLSRLHFVFLCFQIQQSLF